MRIGVICEGPTDFYAVESFLGQAFFDESGVKPEFVSIQPQMDNTSPEAGWGNVLLWFEKNPPELRIQKYFHGGLFSGGLSSEPLDAIVVQLDTDILGEQLFTNYLKDTYDLETTNPKGETQRAEEIRKVIACAANYPAMTSADQNRHVIFAAIEATEAWCVAAFNSPTINCEALSGQTLLDAFMCVLERSEGRTPTPPYSKIDKSPKRRRAFCLKHASGAARVRKGCQHFEEAFQQLLSLH